MTRLVDGQCHDSGKRKVYYEIVQVEQKRVEEVVLVVTTQGMTIRARVRPHRTAYKTRAVFCYHTGKNSNPENGTTGVQMTKK
jgi:hypothetical protein